MTDPTAARNAMVDRQIAGRGVRDPHVLDAMRAVPREAFVEPGSEDDAYADGPLPIGLGQTISQPYIVALMIEAAGVAPGARVLEVGSGCGYAAAVMSRIADEVYAIERHAALNDKAREHLAACGIDNVTLRTGDGTAGWPDAAPFDAIIVSAGAPAVPKMLKNQLAVGARLVVPVGATRTGQALMRVTRTGEAQWEREEICAVSFVPLVGAQGWREPPDR